LWILIHLPLSMFSGLALAIILRDVKGASVVKSAIFLGMVTPMIVGGLILQFTFEEGVGIVNGIFNILGFEQLTRTWTAYPETALFAVIFGSVWLWTGFSLIVYSAGLATIPKEYYEAAKIDGATP
ncbi:ABC transporter permease subunit, partial [Candidatus Bathyarchaeota archaeon]|nr:ABC transporter permease subunit [Candidatus Bathyarchaeota archaeon]